MKYWEPHSSSIDFCEANYFVSDYVVEVHNTWSSLVGLSLFGLIGLILGNPTNERRHTIAYSILVLIGVGSAGLHSTLHWLFQSSDELPMVYLVAILLFMAVEFRSPVGKPTYPQLPLLLVTLMVLNTVIYYSFQDLYIVFYLTFAAGTTAIIAIVHRIINNKEIERGDETKKVGKLGIFSFVCVGLVAWHVEMLLCDWILGFYNRFLFGATVHCLWHFAAGLGAYCCIVFFECCRTEELGLSFRVDYILGGVVPVVVRLGSDDNNCNLKED
mmetsp:Transcript_16960/g.21457  ORF Transcript_16960/g.21457 Transcript_16960/m.21457 type:complete len:272 (+) Transcript_16960:57-872(+)